MAFSKKLETKTLKTILSIYCNNKHHTQKNRLCNDCLHLFHYAEHKIDKCIFGNDKPVCSSCHVHCYSPEMREEIKESMRYGAPKMIFTNPLLSIRYLYRKNFKSK